MFEIKRLRLKTIFGTFEVSLGQKEKGKGQEKTEEASAPEDSIILDAIYGDILAQTGIDALVNPTNSKFAPGNHSLDSKIYAAAGSGLRAELNKLGGCPQGSAEVTQGYDLPYKNIIHVVGRKWKSEDKNKPIFGLDKGKEKISDEEVLRQCYVCVLDKAREFNIRSIAFPSIGTGSNGFPLTKAVGIAFNTVKEYIEKYPDAFDKIVWVLRDDTTYQAYHNVLG